MNVLRKICLQEDNQEFVCAALDVEIYEALVAVLILEDVQVNRRRTRLSSYKLISQVCLHIIKSEISQETSKMMNFYKRSYQPILRYLYTIKCRGEISVRSTLQ